MKTITERTLRAIIRQEINEGLFDFLKREPKPEKPEIVQATGALQKIDPNLNTSQKIETVDLVYKILNAASDYSHKGGMVRFKNPQEAQENFEKVDYLIDNLENLLRSLDKNELRNLYKEARNKYGYQEGFFIIHNLSAFETGDSYVDSRRGNHVIKDQKHLQVVKV